MAPRIVPNPPAGYVLPSGSPPPSAPVPSDPAKAAVAARADSNTAAAALDTAQKNLTTAQGRVAMVNDKITELEGQIAALAKLPHPTKAQKKELRDKRQHLDKVKTIALPKVKQELADASTAVADKRSRLFDAQANALSAEKKANEAYRAAHGPLSLVPFPQADNVDSMQDAASLNRANFKQIAGGADLYGNAEALSSDVKRVDLALKQSPKNGLDMLTSQLAGADPAYREQLLKQVGPQLATMANAAASDPDTAAAYARAMEYAPPATQDQMASLLASKVSGDGGAVAAGLKDRMAVSGDGDAFKVTSKVMQALSKAGKADAADAVAGAAATVVHDLRTDFEEKSAKTQNLSGELARLNYGFGNLTTDTQKKAAIEGFRDAHKSEYGAAELAAGKLASAEAVFSAIPQVDPATVDATRRAQDHTASALDLGLAVADGNKGATALMVESQRVAGDLPALTEFQTGAELTSESLASSVKNGSKSWIDRAITDSKDSKSFAEKAAKGLTKTLGFMAMSGQLGDRVEALGLVKANAAALGIPAKQLGKVQDAIFELYDAREAGGDIAKADAKVASAFGKLEGGKWSDNLKLVGAAIGVAGAVRNFQKWGELDTTKQIKTIVDLSKSGTEGASYFAGLMGKADVVKGLAKAGGGIGVVGGVLNGIIGVQELAKGKLGDGVGDLASGAGDILLGMAAISEEFPGAGTVIGAGLAVAGLVAKHFFGSDPRGDALKASEKDARAYLQSAGVPNALIEPLSHLDIDDHHNIGTFITQAAAQWHMSPQELMEKMAGHPGELNDMVQMVLKMPVDESWNYDATRSPANFGDQSYELRGGMFNYGPKSLETARAWMEERGILP